LHSRQDVAIAVGRHVRPIARDNLGAFVRGDGDLFINYDWVRDWGQFGRLLEAMDLGFRDGSHGIEIIGEKDEHS